MFTLESMTKVRVLDVRVLAKKDRKPDQPPGVQLLLSATMSCGILAMFDGYLPGMLFRKAEGELDGMEGSELTQIGEKVKRLAWQYEQTGCEVTIDFGTGGTRNLVLSDCKVHRLLFSPRQGGSVLVQWCVDAPALSDETRGKLTGLKATETELTLHGPEVADDKQQRLDTDPNAAPADKPKRGKGAKTDRGDGKPDGWPFPEGGAKTDAELAGATH